MLWQVLQICRHLSLKLNKDKCHFWCTSAPFFGEVISRCGVHPHPWKLKALTDMPPPKTKRELHTFLGIINYLDKFSPSTADICESLRKLTSAKIEWTWNAMYQNMFDKAKAIIKEDAYMRFYDETKLLLIETDSFGAGLWASFLQTRSNTCSSRDKVLDNSKLRPTAFSSKGLTGAGKNTAI